MVAFEAPIVSLDGVDLILISISLTTSCLAMTPFSSGVISPSA